MNLILTEKQICNRLEANFDCIGVGSLHATRKRVIREARIGCKLRADFVVLDNDRNDPQMNIVEVKTCAGSSAVGQVMNYVNAAKLAVEFWFSSGAASKAHIVRPKISGFIAARSFDPTAYQVARVAGVGLIRLDFSESGDLIGGSHLPIVDFNDGPSPEVYWAMDTVWMLGAR